MANKGAYTHYYDDLPKIAKIIIQIFLGGPVAIIYRVLRFAETRKVATLIAAIVCLIPPVAFVFFIIDLVTMIAKEQISILAY